MTATSQRDALAADLLADLATPPSGPPPTVTRSVRPLPPPRAAVAATRGPALHTAFRVEPLDWHRPRVSLRRRTLTLRLGPMSAELGLHPG